MSFARTALRAAAVLGATTALSLAGAGAAVAATTSHAVEGNELAVTFTKEGLADADICFAAVAPTAAAPGLIGKVEGATSGDVRDLIDLVSGDSAITVLRTKDLVPSPIPSVILGSQTVYATLESNVYTLVSKCGLDAPQINPGVVVGDPSEAVAGSLNMLSSDGDALGILSSAIGGEGEDGGPLGMLSSALGGATGN